MKLGESPSQIRNPKILNWTVPVAPSRVDGGSAAIRVQFEVSDFGSEMGSRPISTAEPIAIDRVLPHFVIDDALGRSQQPRRFGAIAAGGLQRVEDDIFLVSCDRVS